MNITMKANPEIRVPKVGELFTTVDRDFEIGDFTVLLRTDNGADGEYAAVELSDRLPGGTFQLSEQDEYIILEQTNTLMLTPKTKEKHNEH